MKNITKAILLVCGLLIFFTINQTVSAQTRQEDYTGDIISYNGPRVETANFKLRINQWTSDQEARENLSILQNDGQDKLLKKVQKEDVGTLSIGNGLARTVNVVRESEVNGKTRVFVVFERWMHFAEIRGGYRSMDYPFGVIELLIDPQTGKGQGTYIAAAQIRWVDDRKTGQERVEIENFATYPAKLVNVEMKVKAM